jgi:hypothetical protein
MSFQVTNAMQVKYRNNVELALQQTTSKLESKVIVQDDASAEKIKIKDIVGNTPANEVSERHGDTRYNNPSYDGVWLAKPNELYYADLIDNADRLGTSIDLQGTSTTSGAGTVARAKDQRILEGFYGSAITGKTGTTISAFPTGQIIPVTSGGAAGAQKMNTAKLRAATKMLLQGYADIENAERWMILTADDNDALLTEVPATSADFKEAFSGTVSNGLVQGLLGWRFIHMELDNQLLGSIPDLATDANGYRKTPFWMKNGLAVNYWQRLNTSIDKLASKNLSIQVWAGTTLAATRTQPGLSGIILNAKG